MDRSGKPLLLVEEIEDCGRFDLSKGMLRPLFKRRNELLFRARSTKGTNEQLKSQCIDAKKYMRDAAKISKVRWIMIITELMHSMRFNPKNA